MDAPKAEIAAYAAEIVDQMNSEQVAKIAAAGTAEAWRDGLGQWPDTAGILDDLLDEVARLCINAAEVDGFSVQERLRQHHISLGDRLREARISAGLSARELAEQIDVAPNTIYRIESGEWEPPLRTLRAIVESTGRRLVVRIEEADK